jgi:glycosyltransferase involved in cell wall biosynthesis
MKKVLHIQKVAGIAGSENHLLTLLPGLREIDGYKQTMLVMADPKDHPDPFIERMCSSGVPTDLFTMHGDVDPLLVIQMARYIERQHFDLVHTHLFHADLYGTLSARLAGIHNIVSTKHGFNPWRRKRKYALFDRIAACFQHRIIIISKAVGQWLVQVERLPAEKMRVVHYAIDANHFRRSTGSSDETLANISKPIVGTVTRLIHQKGVHILIQAFAACLERHPEASLVIVGDGPVRSDLEKQASALGIAERVHFLGYVGHPKLSSTIRAFDIFALPTFGEGFGLVLLEAMSWGKAIVASRVMSIPEIVVHGATGLLVSPGDPNALAQALLELMQDQRLCRQFGTAGRQRVEQEFTVRDMIQGTIRVYEEILGPTDTVTAN